MTIATVGLLHPGAMGAAVGRVLTQAGYRIREMHLLDLFPQTFHIESVVVLAL